MKNQGFLTPIITIAILALGFFQTSNSDGDFTLLEQLQLAALLVGAIVTYVSPLVNSPEWASALKVLGAVIGAMLAAVITLVIEGTLLDASMITVIILAGLNAFAAQTGTDARITAAKEALADDKVSNVIPFKVDPVAAEIASRVVPAHAA